VTEVIIGMAVCSNVASATTVQAHGPSKVVGPVASVDGSSAAGTCGTGDSGTFTVTSGATTYTVDVAPTTTFAERGASSPSFQTLCVGDRVVKVFDVLVSIPI
jgi:hypothetical protein